MATFGGAVVDGVAKSIVKPVGSRFVGVLEVATPPQAGLQSSGALELHGCLPGRLPAA